MVDIIHKPDTYYYQCPNCDGGFITATFNRCIDCGIKLNWITEEDDGTEHEDLS